MSAPAIKLLIAPTATTSEIRHIQRVSTGIVPQSKPGTEGQCSENAGDDLECRYLQPTPLPSGHVATSLKQAERHTNIHPFVNDSSHITVNLSSRQDCSRSEEHTSELQQT